MTPFSLSTKRGWLTGLLGLLLLLLSRPETARATHIRAGDIQARVDTTTGPGFNPRRIFFRLTLYTDRTSTVVEDSATVFFGDGVCSPNRNKFARNARFGGPAVGPIRLGTGDTDINYYYFEHTYPAPGTYVVSFIGENRNRNVRNMDESVNKSFYISTTVTIDPSLGRNRSPVLNAPAVDRGAVAQVYLHNPAASDADGDSLAFKLRESQFIPLGVPGVRGCRPEPQVVTGFRFPNDKARSSPNGRQVTYDGDPVGRPPEDAIFVQNVRTGQITWNSPGDAGIYNVAFVVEEWRRTPQGPRKIGEVIRDMQIIVSATTNLRPTIMTFIDTCVIAGARINKRVTAVDNTAPGFQPLTPVDLTAFGGIFPPATFQQITKGPPTAVGRFVWQTECANVASEPYQVLFKAQDTPPAPEPPLIDEKVWRITVVGPPPRLQVAAGRTNGNTALLTWDAYPCASPPGTPVERQVRMLIYRRENPGPAFTPDNCETGIPARLGYRQVGSVSADARAFIDDNAKAGLERGKTYCYRIYAEHPLPAGGASLASNEQCVTFDGRAAVLTNVDVDRTSTTDGQITVRWTRPVAPRAQGGFVPPVSYRLSRAEGLNPAATAFAVIAPAITNLNDTVFVDQRLNTQDRQYTYKLDFLSQLAGQANTETSPTASSVRVTAAASGLTKTIVVNWTYQVPWDNTARPTRVFRRTGSSGPYAQVGAVTSTATGGTYTDNDTSLQLDQTYCYYVQTEGRYGGTPVLPYLQSLLNKSQEQCVPLTSQPCAPVLRPVTINCDSLARLPLFPGIGQKQSYDNRLSWTLGSTPAGCSNANVRYFRIFVSPNDQTPPVLRDSTTATTYVYRSLENNAACYAVQAVDASGRRSPLSNIQCVDACQVFILPNIFTPNGDQSNDTFRPKVSSPVRRVKFQAFNRWGVKVYEGDRDPLINWDGGGARGESAGTGKVSDGLFYYLAEVEFADFKSTRRIYKGWVQVVR